MYNRRQDPMNKTITYISEVAQHIPVDRCFLFPALDAVVHKIEEDEISQRKGIDGKVAFKTRPEQTPFENGVGKANLVYEVISIAAYQTNNIKNLAKESVEILEQRRIA